MLSGHISPTYEGDPNKTDVYRICKEANFNPYLLQHVAGFLISAEVIHNNRSGAYEKGANYAAFWQHSPADLKHITRQGVLRLIDKRTGFKVWRPTGSCPSTMIDFLTVFFGCFSGFALPEADFGTVVRAFSELPIPELSEAGKEFGVARVSHCKEWLDAKGQAALLSALYSAEWAYNTECDKKDWFFPSSMGLAMLGLGKVPEVTKLPTDLNVLPNNCIFAGAGLDMDQLTCFFRYCRTKRIDQIFEFQLDPRRLAEMSSRTSPGEELLTALKDAGPLPQPVAVLLNGTSKLGGVIGIRWRSALVKPEKVETLAAIQKHPNLKGYLEAGAPPGYLLIKSRSDPATFVRRCKELGFEVQILR